MEVENILARFDTAKKDKSALEGDMELMAKFVAPTRIPDKWKNTPDEPLTHELVDPTGQVAVEKFAALVFGNMFQPQRASVLPRIKGRDPVGDEAVWLDNTRDDMHDFFTNGSNSWRPAMMECFMDWAAFGPTSMYTSAKPFGLPEYRAISVFKIYWLEGLDGKATDVFWPTKTSARNAARDFPDNAELQALADKNPDEEVELLYAVYLRPAGRRGAATNQKPWAGNTIWLDKKVVLDDGGYEENPFAVTRLFRRPGEPYGTGLGHRIYPIAKWLNRVKQATADGVEKSVTPPMFDWSGGAIDRYDLRAGGYNSADVGALGFGNINEVIQTLNPTGDLRPGDAMMRDARSEIFAIAYVDWMEGASSGAGVRTATEVLDRRQLRFQSMSALISRLETEFLDPIIDRSFRLLLAAGAFDEMPESLRGETIRFEYRSPLANAQDQGENDAIATGLQGVAQIAELDPNVTDLIDADAMARRWAANGGMPAVLFKTPEQVKAKRDARADEQEAAQENAALTAQATALRDGAQGVASLANAGVETADAA